MLERTRVHVRTPTCLGSHTHTHTHTHLTKCRTPPLSHSVPCGGMRVCEVCVRVCEVCVLTLPLSLRLEENYEFAEGVCIPRSTLYVHYMDYCQDTDSQPVNAASFGKVSRVEDSSRLRPTPPSPAPPRPAPPRPAPPRPGQPRPAPPSSARPSATAQCRQGPPKSRRTSSEFCLWFAHFSWWVGGQEGRGRHRGLGPRIPPLSVSSPGPCGDPAQLRPGRPMPAAGSCTEPSPPGSSPADRAASPRD